MTDLYFFPPIDRLSDVGFGVREGAMSTVFNAVTRVVCLIRADHCFVVS